MAAEERKELVRQIEIRRARIFNDFVLLTLIDASLARLFYDYEKSLDPERLRTLVGQERQNYLDGALTCGDSLSRVCSHQRAIARAVNGETSRILFGMTLPNAARTQLTIIYTALIHSLGFGHFFGLRSPSPFYRQITSTLFAPNGTLEELKNINEREKNLTKLFPLLLALLFIVEATTGLNIPVPIFIATALFSLETLIGFMHEKIENNTVSVFIKNPSIRENQSTFFKTTLAFSDDPANAEMVKVMLNGAERHGFFVRNAAEKGYDLKAKLGDKRAYFVKDDQNPDTYIHLDSKPQRPGKTV